MKHFTINTFAALVLLMLQSCASNVVDTSVDTEKDMAMPEPITKRYPSLDMVRANSKPDLLDAIKEPAEYYTCSGEEDSTLTEDLPLIDVSFIEADILDALLELSLLTGVSIITDDSI